MTDPGKSHRSSIFVITGLCAYLCVALITYVPYLIYINKMSQGDFIGRYPYPKVLMVGVIFQSAAIIISLAAIFFGIRRMRKLGKSFQHGFVVIIGVSMCILFFILNFYVNNKMNQIHKGLFETNIIPKLEERLMKSALTSEQRIFCERQLAKEIYVAQNRLISITDENGNYSLFKPSDKDIAYKKSRDIVKNSILRDKRATRNRMILWITILFFGIFLGRFLPIRKSNG
jgi:hypothetical protein